MLASFGPLWWLGLVLCAVVGTALVPVLVRWVEAEAPRSPEASPRRERIALAIATSLLLAATYLQIGPRAALPAYAFLAVVAVALAVIDVRVHRLPDRIVLPAYLVMIPALTLASAVSGDWAALGRALVAGATLFATYLLLALINPAGMGLGDVKLAGLLGLALGWLGWAELVVGAFGAFLLGGLYALGLLALRRANRHTAMPFGPWMLAGAALGIVAGPWFAASGLW
ncbi:MAG: prepilin peptidase [Cellulomonadaceae bacterium]